MRFLNVFVGAAVVAAAAGCSGESGTSAVRPQGGPMPEAVRARGAGPVDAPIVYRPGTGFWYYLKQFGAGGPLADDQFAYGGHPSDLPVSGDFDGDGTRDVGVFRRATGMWYLLTSRNGSQLLDDVKLAYGGAPTDVPLVGDFDGDGRDDPGVYRAGTGQWFLLTGWSPAGATSDLKLVIGEDLAALPVVGDFDGDGVTDLGTFSPRTGRWLLDTNRDGSAEASFVYGGDGTDVPLAADFDGNGSDDPALYRRGNGRWYLLTGRSGSTLTGDVQVTYGGDPSDLPVAGDFDRDGVADPGIYRRSSGKWYLLTGRSGSTPLSDYQFTYGGGPADLPVTTAVLYDMVLQSPLPARTYAFVPGRQGITSLRVDPNSGALSPVPGSPFGQARTSTPTFNEVLVHPSGRFLYGLVENDYDTFSVPQSVPGFAVDAQTGALSELPGSPYVLDTDDYAFTGAMTGDGQRLYVPTYNLANSSSKLVGLAVDAISGALTPLAGSPFASSLRAEDAMPGPGGRLYTLLNRNGYVGGYSVDPASGALTPLPGHPYPAGTSTSITTSLVFDGAGHAFVFSREQSGNYRMNGFSLEADGSLEPLPGYPMSLPAQADRAIFHAPTRTLYAGVGGGVMAWRIDAGTGAASPVRGFPMTDSRGVAFALDPTGQLLVVSYFGGVSAYRIAPDGFLHPVPGARFLTIPESNILQVFSYPD